MSEAVGMNRRTFISRTAAAAAAVGMGALSLPRSAVAKGPNERLNLGVIGCGGMGTNHLGRLVEMSKDPANNLAVIGICDVYEPRKEYAAAISGAKAYHYHEDLLAVPDLDAVVIATPDHWHAKQSIDAMRAGKAVYCEKPMTYTWQEAKEVYRVQQETGAVFQCGVQSASDGLWWTANRLIREGAIGHLIWSQGGAYRNDPAGDWNWWMDPNCKPGVNLDWDRWLGSAPKVPFDPERYFRFRKFWDYSGGIATDLLYHSLGHLAIALGPEFPKRVVATGGNYIHREREVPDTFMVTIDYPSDHTVILPSTQENETGLPDLIRGQKAVMYFEGGHCVIRPEAPFRGVIEERREPAEPRDEHMINFLKCVRTGGDPSLNAERAYKVMVAIHLSVLSYRRGEVMFFDPRTEEEVDVATARRRRLHVENPLAAQQARARARG